MEIQELFEKVKRWYTTGILSMTDRDALKAEYMRLEEIPAGRCTTCPSFWHEVSVVLRIHLKQNGYLMETPRKFNIADGGTFIDPQTGIHYINEGTESEYVKVINDEYVEKMIKKAPDLKAVFVQNPDYVAPAKEVKPATAKESKPATAKETKPAATKETKLAKPAKDKTEDKPVEPSTATTDSVAPDASAESTAADSEGDEDSEGPEGDEGGNSGEGDNSSQDQ